MFWTLVVVAIIVFVAWFNYNVATKGKAELKNIKLLLAQIEKKPDLPSVYDKFIQTWNSSKWLQSTHFLNEGCYDRILKICKTNSSDIKVWELLYQVVQSLNLSFKIDSNGKLNKTKTFRILADSLIKEFNNQAVKEKIISLIHLLSGLTQAETQELYNIALKILEHNPSNQEAKVLVLSLGRLHYSILRPNKKPTIYDEQAIQNDIIVRSK